MSILERLMRLYAHKIEIISSLLFNYIIVK